MKTTTEFVPTLPADNSDDDRKSRTTSQSLAWTIAGPFVLLLVSIKTSVSEDTIRNSNEGRLLVYVAEFLILTVLYCALHKIAKVWYKRKHKITCFPPLETYMNDRRTKTTKTVGCQTENRNYSDEVEKMKNRHNKEIRNINREIRMMRRRFSEKVSKARCLVKDKDRQLSSLQLKVPQLHKEKASLEDEKEAIEKQLEEEKRRHRDLKTKFNKLHNQMAHPLGKFLNHH